MEELRGTAAIDREILDDARRKAGRIVKAAEKTIAQRNAKNEQQLMAALETERARYNKKFDEFRSEMEALLELDKARIKTERFDSLLRDAAETYLRSLSAGQKKAFIDRTLEKRLRFAFDGAASPAAAAAGGGEAAAADAAASEVAADSLEMSQSDDRARDRSGNPAAPQGRGVGADSPFFAGAARKNAPILGMGEDGSVTLDFPQSAVHVSIEDEIAFLLSERRGELTAALLDGVAEGGNG